MKVLFCAFKYEYGKPELGLATIEYANFFGTLGFMYGVEAEFFAMDEKMRELGKEGMNEALIQRVKEWEPELLFCVLFRDEIKKETISYITTKTRTKTFNWFTDDHWRLPVFSRFWAPLFTMVGTTDSQALKRYASYNIRNVIKTQWGVNPKLYVPHTGTRSYNITFVGKQYGKRERYVSLLNRCNLQAQGFGKGWSSGIIDHTRMLEIFSNSAINLNFTESPYVVLQERIKFFAKLFFKKQDNSYVPSIHPINQTRSYFGAQRHQIKGRTFEVPACGGFLLSGDADNLTDYYEEGKEIAIFRNSEDLLEKCRYYLAHEEVRIRMAQAAYRRTLQEHTYEQRFRKIFNAMELA